jgi:peptidoglycan/xylan/chitin deacetylase (PgdA/CDA1 family)
VSGLYDQDRDLIGYGREVPKVRWPGEARVAVSLVMAYEEGSEYSWAAGDGRSEALAEIAYPKHPAGRDFSTESVFQYGSRAGIWRLARLLDELDIKCTFFGCAVAYELNPAVGRYIQEAGHESACHGWRWEDVFALSREEELEHLRAAVASMEQTCGERPRGWVSRTLRSPHTRELLAEVGGFVYDSDAFDDDLPYFVENRGERHLVVPYTMVHNDTRFVTGTYGDPTAFLDHCRRAFDYLWEEGATHPRMMSIGLHPRWVGQPARASALREFLLYALEKGDVWFARRIDIAHWWIEHYAEFGDATVRRAP